MLLLFYVMVKVRGGIELSVLLVVLIAIRLTYADGILIIPKL